MLKYSKTIRLVIDIHDPVQPRSFRENVKITAPSRDMLHFDTLGKALEKAVKTIYDENRTICFSELAKALSEAIPDCDVEILLDSGTYTINGYPANPERTSIETNNGDSPV